MSMAYLRLFVSCLIRQNYAIKWDIKATKISEKTTQLKYLKRDILT